LGATGCSVISNEVIEMPSCRCFGIRTELREESLPRLPGLDGLMRDGE
jgi:hypothetical protein